DQIAFDRLQLVFGLSRSVEDSETAANRRLLLWGITDTNPWSEVLLGLVKRRGWWKQTIRRLGTINIEQDVQVPCFTQRRVVLIAQTIAQREVRTDSPFILGVRNVVLLLAFALSCRAVIEDAGIG